MKGEAEESDEDVQGQDKPNVLWEKCIQQRIFVDLSEDESLHLNDLENSLALHLSQTESPASDASVHLSAGSAELSDLDVTSSESSDVSSHSERMEERKGSMSHVSAQRPATVHDVSQRYEDLGQNTSDEDQDELPYDGHLGSPYFKQTALSQGSMGSDGRETVHASPHAPGLPECNTENRDDVVERTVSFEGRSEKPATLSRTKQEKFFEALKPSHFAASCHCPADINHVLLQHFTQEELLQPGRLIEAETLPEVSLLESMDDTVLSSASTHHHSHSLVSNSEINQSFCSNRTDEKSHTASKNSRLVKFRDNVTSAAPDSITSTSGGSVNTSVDVAKWEKAEEEEQAQRVTIVRARSFSEMKYGQGQVHYPPPDFSKVAPKVKIPKVPSGAARTAPLSVGTIHRTQSSPGMLEVISRVLEDSVQPSEKPYVFEDTDKAEFVKLLTRCAEEETPLDQMRLAQLSSEQMLYLGCSKDHRGNLAAVEGSHLGSLAPQPAHSGDRTPQSDVKAVTASCGHSEEGRSDGERMTAELTDIISHFIKNVEEFKMSVSNVTVNKAEQQMMLRSIMEAQDQLERKYISKKEEHRALEMQNYMGLSRNTGTFDPNRLVEGNIFRMGMHLEDIKEIIDNNVCEQMPTSTKEMLYVKPLCMSMPSLPPSLHKAPSADFSTVAHKTETQKEDMEEASGDVRLQPSSELMTTDFLLKNTKHSSYISWSTHSSLQGPNGQAAENEDERSSGLSEAIDHSDILAYLSGARSSSRRRQWTPESCSTPQSVLSPVDVCDLGECESLAVEVSSSPNAPRNTISPSEPPLNTSSASQRLVSPETDSGFGSSYLNQSASGSLQPNLFTESVRSQEDDLSSSDSERSCSKLQTAVHSATPTNRRWADPHPSDAAVVVEQWVESTTKVPSFRLQAQTRAEHTPLAQLRHHISEPILSTSMDAEGRGSPRRSCSCNSEAILALQSEVSRLKKDLQEGLVQLPHLVQKMDYLASKYRQERRSNTRTRSHRRSACNSMWEPLNGRKNVNHLSSSQVRIEDWISSDMEPSKSKRLDRNGSVKTSVFKEEEAPDSPANQRPHTNMQRLSLLSSPYLQKPLLQVSYASSSSLPASYKVREQSLLQTASHQRKFSTQSDTALLPSNVYFQRMPPPVSGPTKTGSRAGRCRGSKEDEMNRTLDQAIEVARRMKRTTDRMAKRLSADLAKAQQHRKLHCMQPGGSSKHHTI